MPFRPSQWRGQPMTPGSGELIYQERRRRGWSKPRLCDEIQAWEYRHGNGDVLGLNPNYVREWESGERSVSDYYAPKLSAVLGIPLGTFVDRRTRRGRAAGPSEGRQGEPAPAMAVDVARATAEVSLVPLGARERLLQQWADLAMLGPMGQRLLAKILEPRRALIMDRRTIIKLLGTASTASLLELLRDSGVVASAEAQPPLVLDPTSTYVVDSLALRYQHMYHSTAPAELMIPVTAHLELVNELASTAPTGPQRQQVLRNHSQVALLAGRLSFFDLHDLGTARAYYGMSLDSAREAGDPHLEAVTLGHMSFVAAATRSFRAAIDLLEGANEHASGSTIVPSWLGGRGIRDPLEGRRDGRCPGRGRARRGGTRPRQGDPYLDGLLRRDQAQRLQGLRLPCGRPGRPSGDGPADCRGVPGCGRGEAALGAADRSGDRICP